MALLHKPHQIHLDDLQEDIDNSKRRIEHVLRNRAYKEDFDLFLLGDLAYSLAGQLNMIRGADAVEIYKALYLAADAYAAAFRLALYPAGEKIVTFYLQGGPEDVERWSTGVTSKTHAGRWLTAFYLTMAIHDLADLEGILMRFTREQLEASSTRSAPFLHAQVDAYKAAYLQQPDAPEKLSALFEATSFDTIDFIDREYVLDITKYESGMLGMLMLRNEAGFNSELAQTLEAHRHYYDRDATAYNPDANARNDPKHWVCLSALGMAGWARLLGMRVTVTSEYMPLSPKKSAPTATQGS